MGGGGGGGEVVVGGGGRCGVGRRSVPLLWRFGRRVTLRISLGGWEGMSWLGSGEGCSCWDYKKNLEKNLLQRCQWYQAASSNTPTPITTKSKSEADRIATFLNSPDRRPHKAARSYPPTTRLKGVPHQRHARSYPPTTARSYPPGKGPFPTHPHHHHHHSVSIDATIMTRTSLLRKSKERSGCGQRPPAHPAHHLSTGRSYKTKKSIK